MTNPPTILPTAEDGSPKPQLLRAGPVTMLFGSGDIRRIAFAGREVLRRVYFAIRTPSWGTVRSVVSDVRVEHSGDGFRVSYSGVTTDDTVDFAWTGVVTGDATGFVRFSVAGSARSEFSAGRVGFSVLHPLKECAGARCWVDHADGSREEAKFPSSVAPQQITDGVIQPVPRFGELTAISHQVMPGVIARVELEGDVYEMEDQRNWTDASFKTYSPPLHQPWPITILPSEMIRRSVTIRFDCEGSVRLAESDRHGAKPVYISLPAGPPKPLPSIGLAYSGARTEPGGHAERLLRATCPSHILVSVRFPGGSWRESIATSAMQAKRIGAALNCALYLGEHTEADLRELAAAIRASQIEIAAWSVFDGKGRPADDASLQRVRRIIVADEPGILIGSGSGNSKAGFAVLNRLRPPMGEWDFVTCGIEPQVHASDDLSVMENLEGLAPVVEVLRELADGRPVCWSPLMLSGPTLGFERVADAAALADPRQTRLFAAAWTVGSLKHLAESGVDVMTCFETAGPRGIVVDEEFADSHGTRALPPYVILSTIAEFAGGTIRSSDSDDPLRALGLVLHARDRWRAIVANISADPCPVQLQWSPRGAYVKKLTVSNLDSVMNDPEAFLRERGEQATADQGTLMVQLGAYEVAIVDEPRG